MRQRSSRWSATAAGSGGRPRRRRGGATVAAGSSTGSRGVATWWTTTPTRSPSLPGAGAGVRRGRRCPRVVGGCSPGCRRRDDDRIRGASNAKASATGVAPGASGLAAVRCRMTERATARRLAPARSRSPTGCSAGSPCCCCTTCSTTRTGRSRRSSARARTTCASSARAPASTSSSAGPASRRRASGATSWRPGSSRPLGRATSPD